ncbi:hypothetical protein DFH11DRAFT_1503289 [Phellopilus nigrolimitatus]|nr:hypothetical protein DFH11DRAFT_1503289 [Phellopilus nigrolimitatus]
MQSKRLLQCAFPLIKNHGFTRESLSLAALSLPAPHTEPLSDTAVTSLFGSGDEARRTLLRAWLEEGRNDMETSKEKTASGLLKHRLRWNEPVLQFLPEIFALASSPPSGIPPLDPRPAVWHAASIADQACYLSGDKNTGNAWYAKRATLSTVYIAAELHQIGSPTTAADFLDSLLDSANKLESVFGDTSQFSRYIGRSWSGIYRSLGLQ